MLFSFIIQHERNAFLSHAVYPDNKIGSYRLKLPQTIDLEGNWEVGLYSVTYPNTWYTLQFQQNHLYYSPDGGKSFWSSAIVDYGYYTSMPELIEPINTAMKNELGHTHITFSLNPRTHKVKVTMAKNYYIALYRQLSKMLGFGGGDIKVRKSSESPYVSDLHDIASIFVYCNIVQLQIAGNTSVPLLGTIAVSRKSADIITKTFNNIQYVAVQTKSFESIEILLRTDTGNPVPFERGKVIATLYFRKLSYFDQRCSIRTYSIISSNNRAAACPCSEEAPGREDTDRLATVSAVCFIVLESSLNR